MKYPILGGVFIKKWISIILLCTVFLLAACSFGEEETQQYTGIVSKENALGYEYIVTIENDTFTWIVRHQDKLTIMEETVENKDDLQRFSNAVNESNTHVYSLMIWFTVLLIVGVISYQFRQIARKNNKNYTVIIVIALAIAFYLVFNAVLELTTAYQSVKMQYFRLTK